jgi:hypothetical protein
MRYFLLLALLLLSFGCKKATIVKKGAIPLIAVVSTDPVSILQFEEAVALVLRYEDGDGDLGHPNPDTLLLEVRDARLLFPDYYFVPPLAPEGSEVPIEGELEFRLNGTFLFGNGASEQTTYSIRMRDRKGNWSNTVITPTITIRRN